MQIIWCGMIVSDGRQNIAKMMPSQVQKRFNMSEDIKAG